MIVNQRFKLKNFERRQTSWLYCKWIVIEYFFSVHGQVYSWRLEKSFKVFWVVCFAVADL